MNFLQFLFGKVITLTCILLGGVGWTVFAVVASVEPLVILITDLCAVAAVLIWLTVEYVLIKRRLNRLNELSDTLEERYLLGEVLPKPLNGVEREYFFLMRRLSHAVVSAVEDEKRDREEFCNYVETWIHEIKTPLTACSLILANGGDLARIKTELKRAENLTESILYSARLRTIEKDVQIGELHALDCMNEAVKSQMELLLAAGIGVIVQGDFTAYSDRKTLVFVLKQLLVNSAKYCPQCHITLSAQDGAITLEDDGIGIPPHELPRIFSRGFVGSAAKKTGGTGMGLYFSKRLCDSLGIELTAQSKLGEYTRFSVIFPQNGAK